MQCTSEKCKMATLNFDGKPPEHSAKVSSHSELCKKSVAYVKTNTEAATPAPAYFNVGFESTKSTALQRATFFLHPQEHSKTTTLK